MQKLLKGLYQFQNHVLPDQKERFGRLTEGQSPEALFITCSDSRIDPNLITQTGPGDLFILRNAGNMVPPASEDGVVGGEGATIEYAVRALGIRDIIVCGHSHCGAMKGLLNPESVRELPLVAAWLEQAQETPRIALELESIDDDDAIDGEQPEWLLDRVIEQNVRAQLENLRTYPAVADALARGEVRLHGWVYDIGTGQVNALNAETGLFLPLLGQSDEPRNRSEALINR